MLLESRLSLSLFTQHLNMALSQGGQQTVVESLGKLFLLLSDSVVIVVSCTEKGLHTDTAQRSRSNQQQR